MSHHSRAALLQAPSQPLGPHTRAHQPSTARGNSKQPLPSATTSPTNVLHKPPLSYLPTQSCLKLNSAAADPHTLQLSCCKHTHQRSSGKSYDANKAVRDYSTFVAEVECKRRNDQGMQDKADAEAAQGQKQLKQSGGHHADLPNCKWQPFASEDKGLKASKKGGPGLYYGSIEARLAAEQAAECLDGAEEQLRKLHFLGGYKLNDLECCISHVSEMKEGMKAFGANCEQLHLVQESQAHKKDPTVAHFILPPLGAPQQSIQQGKTTFRSNDVHRNCRRTHSKSR